MTTLEATPIQSRLAEAVGRPKSMVVEASSEGLAQHRLDGCDFDVAIFTNLTRDHLDFHGTMERYLAAKGLLFRKLDEPTAKPYPRAAVVNADDPASKYLKTLSAAPVLTYGIANDAEFRTSRRHCGGLQPPLRCRIRRPDNRGQCADDRRFNVYNSLAAIAVARSQDAPSLTP